MPDNILYICCVCACVQDVYLEISYMYDDDGYQSYCTICCGGRVVLLCGNANCCRSGTRIKKGQIQYTSSMLMCVCVCHLLSFRPSSSRCFCVDCLDILVNPGTSNNARHEDPWRCYMCQPPLQYGILKRRHDWSIKLQEFFGNDNGQEFVSDFAFCKLKQSTMICKLLKTYI